MPPLSSRDKKAMLAMKMSSPAVLEPYVNLNMGDPRVEYYKKRGVGSTVGIPGAGGLGAGISHIMYRVPKANFNRGPTRNNVRRIQKEEYNAIMAAEAAEQAAANLVRKGEMNANVAGIVYTDEPTTKIDIDGPIHLESLAEKGRPLAIEMLKKRNENAYPRRKMPRKTYSPNVDQVIEALRNAFIDAEKGKVYQSSHAQAEAKQPKDRDGRIMREFYGRIPLERDRLVQEHIDRKMPKIEAVLAKLREGMILGFPSPPPKVAPKEENLLRFENLSSINFSAPPGTAAAGSGAPPLVDPFEGLNAELGHNDFVAAGIEIEPETLIRLRKNQKQDLLNRLMGKNKSEHDSTINAFLANVLRRGGKRKTNKRKSKKTRKVRRS